MSFLKRIMSGLLTWYLMILVNTLILTTLSIPAFLIATTLVKMGIIKGAWSIYLVYLGILYSLFGFGMAFIGLWISRWSARKIMKVRLIDPQSAQGRERELVEMVHGISRRARLPAQPQIGIYDSPQPNAFATGPSKRRSLVAVSTGLLNSMNKEELEGVLAHEVAHITNGDMVRMTLLQGMINSMVLVIAHIASDVIGSLMRTRSRFIRFAIFMALQIALGMLGSLALCSYSRRREYRADKGGARFAGVPSMVSALKALQRVQDLGSVAGQALSSKQESYGYFQISGKTGKTGANWKNWFSTHPPLEDRIARLERFYS